MAGEKIKKGISIIIPTYNGGLTLSRYLKKIHRQRYDGEIQLIIIDSGSSDGTTEMAKEAGALIKKIDKKKFHHSNTRNYAIAFAKYDQVVFTVQDALPVSNTWLSALEKALNENDVSAVYTKQIPHKDAEPYARFEVENHNSNLGSVPVIQQIESLESFQKMNYPQALRTIRLDNVCAIYRKDRLYKIPFPDIDYGEDMAWALQSMLAGDKILYQPNIQVMHSHNRSPEYRFKRTIINSISCALILNRIEQDLSFIELIHLNDLKFEVLKVIKILKTIIIEEKSNDSQRTHAIHRAIKCHSLTHKNNRYTRHYYSLNKENQIKTEKLFIQSIDNIKYILDLIQKKYNVTQKEKRSSILEQITATILGNIFGEVYSSYLLKKNLTLDMMEFFRPYMHGV